MTTTDRQVDLADVLREWEPVGHWTPKGEADNGSAIYVFCTGHDCTDPAAHATNRRRRSQHRYGAWHSSFFPGDPPPHEKPVWE